MACAVFQSTLLKHDMLGQGDGVVAALSGGPDSTALLCLLVEIAGEMDLRIHGAHFNHRLRGAEADEDEAFVRRQCRRFGVPCTAARAATPPGKGENVEQWAREARYRFLDQVRSDLGFRRIALGHTRDDLAETFLMRLIRGSGLSGLACLRPVREDGVIRPMLGLSRAAVLGYLAEKGESWREDPGNQDLDRLRNRVRHELLPLLERNYNPRIRERLAGTAGLVLDDEEQLDLAAERELAGVVAEAEDDGLVELSCSRLLGLPAALARRVVRGALRRSLGHLLSVDRGHVEAVLALAASGGSGERRLDLPGDLLVRVSYDRLIVDTGPGVQEVGEWCRPLEAPGRTLLEDCGLVAVAELGPGPEPDTDRWPDVRTTVLLDGAAAVGAGLVLRSCRSGDRYRPAGAPGSRKVSRMLIDDRVPRHRRGLVPLLAAGEEPIWLPGHRPAAGWCWQEGACLRLELHPAGNGEQGA